MRLHHLTWTCFRVVTDTGLSLLFDPWLSGAGTPEVPASPVSVDELGPIDYIVITHTTADHVGQTAEIMQRHPSVTLLCGKDVALYIQDAGIPASRMVYFSPGSSLTVDGVWIKAVLAHHISMRERPNHSYLSGLPFSYFVREQSGVTLFNAGDTSLHSEMKLFGDLYKPDIALLGVGGLRGDQVSRGVLGPVLPVPEAVVAAKMLGVRYAVPMHYLLNTGVEEQWRSAFAQEAPAITPLIMGLDEEITLTKEPGAPAVATPPARR